MNSAAIVLGRPEQSDTFELGVLDENIPGLVVEEELGGAMDEKRWKVRHVFGACALDWRDMVKIV